MRKVIIRAYDGDGQQKYNERHYFGELYDLRDYITDNYDTDNYTIVRARADYVELLNYNTDEYEYWEMEEADEEKCD